MINNDTIFLVKPITYYIYTFNFIIGTKALFRRAKALYMDMNSSTDEYKRAV